LLDSIKWDKNGLAVAIAQHINTGAILMQGFADPDAVSATLASGRATFYSRSRASLWTKGESSSNFINVKDVFIDCDRDSVSFFSRITRGQSVVFCYWFISFKH
jgi:phosphoribosyl-AMP cyclohydrolase